MAPAAAEGQGTSRHRRCGRRAHEAARQSKEARRAPGSPELAHLLRRERVSQCDIDFVYGRVDSFFATILV